MTDLNEVKKRDAATVDMIFYLCKNGYLDLYESQTPESILEAIKQFCIDAGYKNVTYENAEEIAIEHFLNKK